MNYILDTNTIYYCSGVSKHKSFSRNELNKRIKSGRKLYISLWSLIELATHFEFSKDQKKRVIKYIYNNQLEIIPFYVEQKCSIHTLNKFLSEYKYVLKPHDVIYKNSSSQQMKISSYSLNKTNSKYCHKKTFEKVAKEKSKVEAFFLRFFFTNSYYNLLKLFEIDLKTQSQKDHFTSSCEKNIRNKIISMNNEYEVKLLNCYLRKTKKERVKSIGEVKKSFYDDYLTYQLDIANLYQIFQPHGTYENIHLYFTHLRQNGNTPFCNLLIKPSGKRILFEDFIKESDYKIHIENVSNSLIAFEGDPLNRECLKSYYLYMNAINTKQLFTGSKIEKNDMFDVQYFSYYPDFRPFTCDKKMANNISRIDSTLYTELVPYL